MSRWLVQLDGDRLDLDDFLYSFPNGNVHTIKEDGIVYLVGPDFEKFTENSEVHEAALQVLDEFSATIKLTNRFHQRTKVEKIIRENDKGERNVSVVPLTCSICTRSSMRVLTPVPGSPTPAQILLSGSRKSKHLQVAICLWADEITWPRLYRILEEIQMYLGKKVHKANLCSRAELNRFTSSANNADISGKDSRHAIGYCKKSDLKPMNLEEATAFVSGLLQEVLKKAATGHPSH